MSLYVNRRPDGLNRESERLTLRPSPHSYYASLIRGTHITVSSVLATAISGLTTEQQAELVKELGKVLAAKGVQAIGM